VGEGLKELRCAEVEEVHDIERSKVAHSVEVDAHLMTFFEELRI
jgi:hypothetical protein